MMREVRLILRALSYEMVYAWQRHFAGEASVSCEQGDIFGRTADAIVSPANGFGYMDGGIDLVYSQRLGWQVEARVRARLLAEHDGELPVGQALIVETGREELPLLISAPTMRVPMDVSSTAHAFLAFRAALRAVREHNRSQPRRIESVLCPGLCTGEGRMPYDRAARQMRAAYDVVVLGKVETKGGLARAVEGHIALVK
jgi:O-acetyl-ADP-ribose deacetylase (regulator of RNase III)